MRSNSPRSHRVNLALLASISVPGISLSGETTMRTYLRLPSFPIESRTTGLLVMLSIRESTLIYLQHAKPPNISFRNDLNHVIDTTIFFSFLLSQRSGASFLHLDRMTNGLSQSIASWHWLGNLILDLCTAPEVMISLTDIHFPLIWGFCFAHLSLLKGICYTRTRLQPFFFFSFSFLFNYLLSFRDRKIPSSLGSDPFLTVLGISFLFLCFSLVSTSHNWITFYTIFILIPHIN